MNYLHTLIVSISLSAASVALAADGSPKLPPRFQGLWAQDLKNCAAPGEGYFKLDERKVVGYESVGTIKAVVTRGNEIALIAEVSGEGETWLSAQLYELSKDGKTLIDKNSYPHVRRYRCP